MRFKFHPEALEEYREAARYYAERQTDLDLRFVEAVETAIGRILAGPEQWPHLEDDIRRCLTRVFPYGIIYTVEPAYVLIVAVAHCSREPYYWKGRID